MSDSQSYADRARKAISPSNLAVKALSIVANHSPPATIDDWPQVAKANPSSKARSPSRPSDLPFILSKSISSPQNKSSQYEYGPSWNDSAVDAVPTSGNPKVMFGSIGLENSTPPLPPPSSAEIPTKTPTFSVGLDDSSAVRLRSRTRGRLDELDDARNNDSTTSAIQPNKWKFGTMSSTPLINRNKQLPEEEIQVQDPPSSSSSLLFHPPSVESQPNTDSTHRREWGISFGYIDTPLPLDHTNFSISNKAKPKTKTKTKVNTNTNISPNVDIEIKSNPNSNDQNQNHNREEPDRDVDLDTDFKVKNFGYGFGSGGFGSAQVGVGLGLESGVVQEDGNETGDAQDVAVPHQNQLTQPCPQQNHHTRPIIRLVTAPIPQQQPLQNNPTHISAPTPTSQHQNGPYLYPRPSKRGNMVNRGGYGSHERGGYGSHERGGTGRRGRGGMNGYSRGYGRGYRGGGPGPASSHSSPSPGGGGGGGHRTPFADNTTPPPALPPLPLHFSQQQQHGIDSMYYPPQRHISGGGPGPFDPYQPYPHLQHLPPHLQQHSHLLPPLYLQNYSQPPPPLPSHLVTSPSGGIASSGAEGDDMPSDSTATTPSPLNGPSTTSSASTTPPPSSTPPSAHIPPPVPIPLTILPFALDPTRYYLLGQLEYYLSPQNMVQDFFLRTQMDSKGYIPISLLASFNRIKQLTLDTRLVREVLLLSAFVEVRGGMVRMGGAAAAAAAASGGDGDDVRGQEIPNQNQGSWESFVLPDAVESVVVEDVETVESGNYGYHNAYGYGSGYGYGYGASGTGGPGGPGYGYGYGYGYSVGPGLGYYEDPQSQHQHQGGGVDEQGHTSANEQEQPSMINGYGDIGSGHHDPPPHNQTEENKPNGILKHEHEGVAQQVEDEGEEYEDEEEEEDVVFVMGTDAGTSWSPERERRA